VSAALHIAQFMVPSVPGHETGTEIGGNMRSDPRNWHCRKAVWPKTTIRCWMRIQVMKASELPWFVASILNLLSPGMDGQSCIEHI
jgi:hypothetical protein